MREMRNTPAEKICVSRELPDPAATEALARDVAALARPRDLVTLAGEIGAGKTAFARAFIRERAAVAGASGTIDEVPSPTFTLAQSYDFPGGTVWHFDLYRLESPAETLELGIEEAYSNGIALVEWPDRLDRRLPRDRLEIELVFTHRFEGRRASLRGWGNWAARVAGLATVG